jgi:L-ornithine Nalpha-acyltransferase
MRSFRCIIAKTEREIIDAQRLRWEVYGEEEGLLPRSVCEGGREIDALDDRESTIHFLVYAGQEAVGTVRLLRPATEMEERPGGTLGLDLESKINLSALAAPGVSAGEVTRYCVLRRYRRTGATGALFAALYAESARRGVTHWVAGANMETDCAEDAVLAYRVAHEKSLMNERIHAEPRADEIPETPRRRPYYTAEQRMRAQEGNLTGLELPRTLALFAARMGARFIGPPVYDTYFNIFALPLVASLADIGAKRATTLALHGQERLQGEARA